MSVPEAEAYLPAFVLLHVLQSICRLSGSVLPPSARGVSIPEAEAYFPSRLSLLPSRFSQSPHFLHAGSLRRRSQGRPAA